MMILGLKIHLLTPYFVPGKTTAPDAKGKRRNLVLRGGKLMKSRGLLDNLRMV